MNSSTPLEQRTCEQCRKPIEVDARAPHKRFCSITCKATYWRRARKAGEAALRASENAA